MVELAMKRSSRTLVVLEALSLRKRKVNRAWMRDSQIAGPDGRTGPRRFMFVRQYREPTRFSPPTPRLYGVVVKTKNRHLFAYTSASANECGLVLGLEKKIKVCP